MIENIASFNVLQEEVNSKVVLEHIFHREDERVLRLEQDIFLRLCIDDLTLFDKNILINSLHSQLSAGLLVHDQEHFAKRSLIDNFLDLEIL